MQFEEAVRQGKHVFTEKTRGRGRHGRAKISRRRRRSEEEKFESRPSDFSGIITPDTLIIKRLQDGAIWRHRGDACLLERQHAVGSSAG